jgi:hypothetical protein
MTAINQSYQVEIRASTGHRIVIQVRAFDPSEACDTAENKARGRWAAFQILAGSMKSRVISVEGDAA